METMHGKNLHKKNRDFGKTVFFWFFFWQNYTQILKGQTLTAALSHNGDVYCMEGS